MAGDETDARRFLMTYLRDHRGGAVAGLSMVRHCQRMNEGTEFERELAGLAGEIAADCDTLDSIMARLDISPSQVKRAVGAVSERLSRLMMNDRLVRYASITRMLELEGLAAGIESKRNLWRALRTVSGAHEGLDAVELDGLVTRATSQHERVTELHGRAAAMALGHG